MILFLLKGLIRDRSRSLFPVLTVFIGVFLAVFLYSYMDGVMSEPGSYDAGSIADEINQALDEVTQGLMPQEEEPDLFQAQYMMGQNIFDQMQYMANPSMMPGPYGPVGPGPYGPMPGIMPGPMPGP